jgi:hypothetical protein
MLVLVLVFSVLSIILIAVWGTLPENPNNVQATSLIVSDFDETNDDGDKFKNVTDIVTEQNNIYTIDFTVDPGNSNVDITATASISGVNLQVDAAAGKIYVIYNLETISAKTTVTIQIKDKYTQVYDELTLWFKTPGVIIVPEI